MNALLVIDVQSFFTNKYTKHLPQKIADFIKKHEFDFILFFLFYNHPKSNFVKLHNWKKMYAPPETDAASELKPFLNENNTFKKYSFSVFKAEGFQEFLSQNKINHLYLCGIDTDACVLTSEMEAFERGFDAYVIEDLCSSHNGALYHQKAIDLLKKNLGKQAIIKSAVFK